ncbi:hypothetical protein RFI_07183 [Reticulomyxa filosa]|uniref:Vesicle transport v-SNARE N-terminal domain-containing protein n=1 Tax=Reticulomyxa filosa TaxID=46433 RepID=X6NVB1_RETFI|nr:hypothetical protein RFI_07183 [Reticulomyxa filosa]|eukprot:ETO29936.1 hypothetical protein RFI_07183 [Reticulomyxa filosa]
MTKKSKTHLLPSAGIISFNIFVKMCPNKKKSVAEKRKKFFFELLGEKPKKKKTRKISSLKKTEKSRGLIDGITSDLSECQQTVRNMELELRSLDPNTKSKWQDRVNRYKTDLKTLQQDFDREKEIAQRSELFPGAKDAANEILLNWKKKKGTTTDEQARLISTADQSRKDTDMLRDSAKQLHDTEQQAMEISGELVEQKNRINNIRKNLGEGNTVLGRVGRVLGRMGRRQAMMSVMWCFIIIIILTVIALIIYFKFR